MVFRATRVPLHGEDSSQGTQLQYPMSILRTVGQETSTSLASEDRAKPATLASFSRLTPLNVSVFCVLGQLHHWKGSGVYFGLLDQQKVLVGVFSLVSEKKPRRLYPDSLACLGQE